MRRVLSLTFGLVLMLAAPACVKTPVAYVRTGAPGERELAATDERAIRVFAETDAMPPHVEIGYLEVDQGITLPSADPYTTRTWTGGFRQALRAVAAAHGCDAIVLHDGCVQTTRDQGLIVGPPHEQRRARLTATCVRFTTDG